LEQLNMKKLQSNVLAIAATLCAVVANPAAALASGTCQATINISTSSTGVSCATSLSESATGIANFLINNQVQVKATYLAGQSGAQGAMLNSQGGIVCTTNLVTVIGQTQQNICANAGAVTFRLTVN
jgi:hypothetical protein